MKTVISKLWNNTSLLLEAAANYQTPFYCYDANTLQQSYTELRIALPACIDIFYSVKANPNIAIMNELKQLGAHVELCSYYEIAAALKVGFKPSNIIFVGPAKSDQEIKACLELNIYAIVCESLEEFSRIAIIAQKLNVVARVALRINPSHVSKSALLKMGGRPSQFGMDEEVIIENEYFFKNKSHVKIIGIHVYNGTRILNAETVIENTDYIFKLARSIQERWHCIFEMIDIGGGLGIPYFDNENELDIVALKVGMHSIIEKYKEFFPSTRIILESGRYLVAKSGALISRILDIKKSKGEYFAITDGGTNCHMAAVGIGSLVVRNFPISAIHQSALKNTSTETYNITGPLCTPGDLVGKQVLLPKVSIGDLILIKNSGAYGPTASPVMFLSHGFPIEILYKNEKFYLIRDKFNENEFFEKQYLIK